VIWVEQSIVAPQHYTDCLCAATALPACTSPAPPCHSLPPCCSVSSCCLLRHGSACQHQVQSAPAANSADSQGIPVQPLYSFPLCNCSAPKTHASPPAGVVVLLPHACMVHHYAPQLLIKHAARCKVESSLCCPPSQPTHVQQTPPRLALLD
jgi:hypothetical protein